MATRLPPVQDAYAATVEGWVFNATQILIYKMIPLCTRGSVLGRSCCWP